MAGEDFSFYCLEVSEVLPSLGNNLALDHVHVHVADLISPVQLPCAFAFLGIRNETVGSIHALHNAK